jgi:hypothetical protein
MFKKIKATEIPKRKRKSVTRFERTPEWGHMRASLEQGLKTGEACYVTFTAEEKSKYRIKSLRSCARFVKKYLQAAKLPYKVRAYHSEAGDTITVSK